MLELTEARARLAVFLIDCEVLFTEVYVVLLLVARRRSPLWELVTVIQKPDREGVVSHVTIQP